MSNVFLDIIKNNELVYTPDTINTLEHPDKEEWIETYMGDNDTYRIVRFNDIFNDKLINKCMNHYRFWNILLCLTYYSAILSKLESVCQALLTPSCKHYSEGKNDQWILALQGDRGMLRQPKIH